MATLLKQQSVYSNSLCPRIKLTYFIQIWGTFYINYNMLIYNNNVTNGCSISCSGRQGSASLVIDAEGVNALILSAVTKC